jgi:hypothetical protein
VKSRSSTLLLRCFHTAATLLSTLRYAANGDVVELLLPVALPGEDRGNGHRTFQPGLWLPSAEQEARFRIAFFIVFLRLREWHRVTSGPALSRRFFLIGLPNETCLVPARLVSKAYGIAKLLPLIVPVKRETLQVVSSTMTGLMRGRRNCFPQEEFMGRSQLWGRGWRGVVLGFVGGAARSGSA